MRRHYLDHASTSPLRPAARRALAEALEATVGDPGRIHVEGMSARAALEQARADVARLVNARPREVVFTSGATEAICAAIWGAVERGEHIVVSAVEHSAVRFGAAAFTRQGLEQVTVVGVDHTGRVDPDAVIDAIGETTALVAVQWANHEVGTRQPVEAIATACRERGVLLLVDAAQGVGHDRIDFRELGADLLAFSGHKLGGPLGIGVLCIRRGLRLRPLLVGGDQERARRAGLENVPAALGLAAACNALDPEHLDAEIAHQRALTDTLTAALEQLDGVVCFGHRTERAPHIVCAGIEGIEPQAVLLGLDRAGIAAHSGSACSSEDLLPSPVLEAMGVDAHRSLRLSVGWSSTSDDVDAVIATLSPLIDELRALGRSERGSVSPPG